MTAREFANYKNIFLLSERGYTKLVAMMANDNEKKWEVMDKLIDDYFSMREALRPQLPQDYLSTLKALETLIKNIKKFKKSVDTLKQKEYN